MTENDVRTMAAILQDAVKQLNTVTAAGGWDGIDDEEQPEPELVDNGHECPACGYGRMGRRVNAETVWLRYKMLDSHNRITNAGGKRSQQYKAWLLLRAFDDGWDLSIFGSWLSGDLERRRELGQEVTDDELDMLWKIDEAYESYRQTVQTFKRENGL